jgi:hypothetical protein
MRSLHRDIGFFVIGLTIIYCISGIVLVYRNTSFFRQEILIEKKLPPNMESMELGKALGNKKFKVSKTEGEILYFRNGSYDKETGNVKYLTYSYPVLIKMFIQLHMASTNSNVHWFTVVYGISLLFLTISSFWMYKPKTKLFRRGLYFTASGIVAVIILLVLLM